MANVFHSRNIIKGGNQSGNAKNALILLHGRGGSAQDILSLAPHLVSKEFALFAPQATNHTWYPASFMAPLSANEPWLTSALELVNDTVKEVMDSGITKENIYFAGFSQGACLTLEYTTRNAAKYGGVIAFTGGLIGERLDPNKYSGNFERTHIFIGSSDPDIHVPAERVYSSAELITNLNADVKVKIYPNMGHTITNDEITLAKKFIFDEA